MPSIDGYKADRISKNDLPEVGRPEWLSEEALDDDLPLREILTDSVYYPASGLDGDPLRYLGHHFWSFVYVDYGFDPKSIRDELHAEHFSFYKVIGRRSVGEEEVPLARWNRETSDWLMGGNNRFARRRATPPYAEWALLERNYGPERPRELMSFLFVGADGVTLLDKLYVENEIAPACVAVIQPSDRQGSNWTDFAGPPAANALHRTLAKNPAGMPRFLLYGGGGKPEWYRKKTCWSAYDERIAWPLIREDTQREDIIPRKRLEGALSLWKRGD